MAIQALEMQDLQTRLAEIVEKVHHLADRFVITRRGEARAMLIAVDDFEGLLETIDILANQELVQHLVVAEEEFASGGGTSLRELRAAPQVTSHSRPRR